MKIIYLFFFFLVGFLGLSAQELKGDTSYLEDQFYMGLTYNLLLDKPTGVERRNLPYGFHFGYIKDLPMNASRTIGVGLGLGYAINNYYSNILAEATNSKPVYSIIASDVAFKRSKIETHLIELPVELRWRTSNTTAYKFWRLYAGAKFGYVFSGRSKYVSDGKKISFTNNDIRKFQYGLTLNFGYNTWNIHVYYQLNKLFNDSVFMENTAEEIKFKPLRIGVIFYIL